MAPTILRCLQVKSALKRQQQSIFLSNYTNVEHQAVRFHFACSCVFERERCSKAQHTAFVIHAATISEIGAAFLLLLKMISLQCEQSIAQRWVDHQAYCILNILFGDTQDIFLCRS